MRINSIDNSFNFKASKINILSIADNHGDILKMQQLMKGFQINKRELFEKASENSTLNLFAIAGDFFMNPQKKGFINNPEFCNGDIQYNFLTKLIYCAKMAAGINNKFDTVYTMGNHCLDGGDKWLFEKLKRAPMTTVETNAILGKSPILQRAMEECNNIVTHKVYEIPDSKKINKTNKLLVLGVNMPSVDYYNPNLLEELCFYDNSKKADSMLTEKDVQKTMSVIRHYVKEFKQEEPNGAIVVLSHMGNKLSTIMAEKNPEINLILNGHDHKEFESLVGSTLILSHGEASKFFRGTQVKIDDNGKVYMQSRKYEAEQYEPQARKDKGIQDFVNVCIRKDLEPLVKFDRFGATSKELVLDDSIRYSNNIIANYLTTGIKEAATKHIPDLDLVGLPSTIIRNGLKSHAGRTTMNNIDFMKIFDGVNATIEDLKVGTITGKELYNLILENVLNNLKSRTRNALIQWSDIQINRTAIKNLKDSCKADGFRDNIMIRNLITKKFEKIDFEKEYKILFSEKYLMKDTEDIKIPSKIRHKFKTTNYTYDSLFKEYLQSIDYDIKIKNNVREERII